MVLEAQLEMRAGVLGRSGHESGTDQELAPPGLSVQRVEHEVDDDALELARHAQDTIGLGAQVPAQGDAAPGEVPIEELSDLRDELVEGDRLPGLRLVRAQLENVGDSGREPVHLSQADRDRLPVALGNLVGPPPPLESLQVHLHRAERVPDLVGQVGGQLPQHGEPAGLVRPGHHDPEALGHVLEREREAPHLVVRGGGKPGAQIALGHLLRSTGQVAQRPRDRPEQGREHEDGGPGQAQREEPIARKDVGEGSGKRTGPAGHDGQPERGDRGRGEGLLRARAGPRPDLDGRVKARSRPAGRGGHEPSLRVVRPQLDVGMKAAVERRPVPGDQRPAPTLQGELDQDRRRVESVAATGIGRRIAESDRRGRLRGNDAQMGKAPGPSCGAALLEPRQDLAGRIG